MKPASETRIPRVLVLHGGTIDEAHSFLMSVERYAREHGPWQLIFGHGSASEGLYDIARTEYDGIISDYDELNIVRRLYHPGTPIVLIEAGHSRRPKEFARAPSVNSDSTRIGILAADYLLSLGYRSFAYVGALHGRGWMRERQISFVSRLREQRIPCQLFTTPQAGRFARKCNFPALVRFLTALPKPTAVFAATDGRGRTVIDACTAAGLTVPGDIAVLGVDNDRTICTSSQPELSSIDKQTDGSRAAEALHALMEGRAPRPSALRSPEPRIVPRQSLGYGATSDALIAKAVGYIRLAGNAGPLTVRSVAMHCACSSRHLESRFAHLLGHTVKEEIERVRFARTEELLRDPHLTLASIAERCGFTDPCHFATRFRTRYGTSPGQWRKEFFLIKGHTPHHP